MKMIWRAAGLFRRSLMNAAPEAVASGYLIALWEPDQPELRSTYLVTSANTSVDFAAVSGGKAISGVSIASIDAAGHMSFFSPELITRP